MSKRQIYKNTLFSVLQVFVTAGVLFVLYQLIKSELGVGSLGIWSLVLATTSVASIANLGLSSSVVKFVARHLARGEASLASEVIETTILTLGGFMGVVMLFSWPLVSHLLEKSIPPERLSEALAILPQALLTLWINILASTYQAGLDGKQRIDIRSSILMVLSLVHLALCFYIVPEYGLVGLANLRVAQVAVLLLANAFFLKKILPEFHIIPRRFNFSILKEVWSYGLNFQVATLFIFLCDPLSKILMTRFGGLELTGLYEMASGMVTQIRSVLITANRALVPSIASLHETNREKVQSLFLQSQRLMTLFSIPTFILLASSSAYISRIWLGYVDHHFIYITIVLCASWCINTICAPTYFSNLGLGELKWNTLAHVFIACLNLICGFTLGQLIGGEGVIAGWAIALAVGSLLTPFFYFKKHLIPFKLFVTKADLLLFLIISLSGYLLYRAEPQIVIWGDTWVLLLPIFAASVLGAVSLLFHPSGRGLKEAFLRKSGIKTPFAQTDKI